MPVVCEHCGTSNRATAMFCIGCAGRLPAFVATGPSALETLGVTSGAMRGPAVGVARPVGGVASVAETPAFWLTLGVAGLVALAAAAGWYVLRSRDGTDASAPRVERPAAERRVASAPATPATAATAATPASGARPEAAATASPSEAKPAPWEWLDKAEELVDGVTNRSTTPAPSAPPLTPLVPAPMARDDLGPDTPTRVVAAFYGALAAGDGQAAAAVITPAKRDIGRFSGARMTQFYGSFNEPLEVRSIRQIDAQAVEARYTYRATRTVCEGVALVRTERIGGQTVIRSIRANC